MNEEEITYKDRLLSSIAYIWPLGLFLLPFKNKNSFRKRHIFDGMLLTIFITFLGAIKIMADELLFTRYENDYEKYLSYTKQLNKWITIAFGLTILFQIYRLIKVWITKNKKKDE